MLWLGRSVARTTKRGAWHKILISLNENSNIHLYWSMLQGKKILAKLLASRVLKRNMVISHHIYFSLWSGFKSQFSIVMDNSHWILCNDGLIKNLLDTWMEVPLVQNFNITDVYHTTLTFLDCEFMINKTQSLPLNLHINFPNLLTYISKFHIPKPQTTFYLNVNFHAISGSGSLIPSTILCP